MARFYTMRLQETLFAEWSLVREWGRIGRSGQVREDTFKTSLEAEQAFTKIQQAKTRRGYIPVGNLPHALKRITQNACVLTFASYILR